MPEYATLNVSIQDNLARVTIDNGRVNAIDTPLSRDLELAFLELGADDQVGGVVLSGKPHCFCAGLDIKMLATSNRQELRSFFSTYLSALQTMVRFDKPLVAAVTGYAPAGGTVLALTADYRVMGRGTKHTLGMNEFNMSLQVPRLMADIFAYYLGEAAAWASVQNARMFDSDAALTLGLVNESVEVDQVTERAEAHCRKLMQVHFPVFRRTKRYMRRELLAAVDHGVEQMVDTIEEDFDDPVFQQMTKYFLASLK